MKKETIFIYSIIRNREESVNTFYTQVKDIVKLFPQYNFLLCLYENDSTDRTKERISKLDWSFVEHEIIMEDIGTQYFGSTNEEMRVRVLSDARNKALEAKDFLERSDYVLMLEADMVFTMQSIEKIFKFKEKMPDLDVVSSRSINPKGRAKLYDTWGTRRNSTETIGHLHEDWRSHKYQKYYATSNGICMYRSQPLKDGIRYGHFNKTLGHHDCEMVVICDNLQRAGYENIYMVYSATAIHIGK
jgi:hypothetical protein